jgi:hypothetical protein
MKSAHRGGFYFATGAGEASIFQRGNPVGSPRYSAIPPTVNLGHMLKNLQAGKVDKVPGGLIQHKGRRGLGSEPH